VQKPGGHERARIAVNRHHARPIVASAADTTAVIVHQPQRIAR